jgi:ABC-type Fe3+ transport system permease subunit
MVTATIGRRVARLRHPARARRIALALWIVWAIVVWNVVLDRVIVLAGRDYVYAAALAARGRGPSVRMDDYMRPAVTRGLSIASISATAIVIVGVVAIRAASRPARPLNP